MALKAITVSNKSFDSEKYSFDDKGDIMEGYLVDSVSLPGEGGKTFRKYTVKNDSGHYSFLGGYQLDAALKEVQLGTYIRITYKGKKKLGGGKTMKEFTIEADDENVIDV